MTYILPLKKIHCLSIKFCLVISIWACSFLSASAQCSSCQVHITPGVVDSLCNKQTLSWAKWTSVTATSATGTISSGINITCSQATGGMFTTGTMYGGGNFPVQYKVPVSTTAIANSKAGVFTFCFSKPVTNPQIALASIGTPSQTVQINTSVPYCVIWQGVAMTYLSDTSLSGREGYTIIRFPGTHTCISFNYLQNEYYWNLAFGVQDTSCQVVAPVLCKGDGVTLNATGGSSFTWTPSVGLNADTGAAVVATPSVTTRYYVTDGICTDSLLVTVNAPTAISADTAICYGGYVQLHAGGGSIYKWSPAAGLSDPNSADPVAFPQTSTTYTVSISPAPCDDSTATISITVYPTPPVPVIKQVHDTLLCRVDASYASYQWYFDNQPIPGATDSVFLSTQSGNYNVAVIDTNGCIISVGINIVLGLSSPGAGNLSFTLSPNPAGKELVVRSAGAVKGEHVAIYDVVGREVMIAGYVALKEGGATIVDISTLPAGVYFLQLRSANGSGVRKFVKE